MKTESRFGGNMGWIVRMKKKMQEFMANDTARSICDACPLMFLSIDDAPFLFVIYWYLIVYKMFF